MSGETPTFEVLGSMPTHLLVAGTWREASTRSTFPVEDPATGGVIAEVSDASVEDAVAALDAAVEQQEGWAESTPKTRSEVLGRAADELLAQSEHVAMVMTLEMGKPFSEALGEVAYAADYLRWFAGEALRLGGDYRVSSDGKGRILLMKQPVGPALLITPWNFPLAMGARKIGPALAAGCTTIVKPAQQTPLTMLLLAEILEGSGVPPGVINVVPTTSPGETMAPLLADPRLRKLSFTGSTEVGRMLLEQAAPNVLKTSLELGGNAPFIVFDDADLDAAVDGAMAAKMRNIGEACTAANRFFVASSIAEEFSQRLAARMGSLQVGHGAMPDTAVGPLIDEAALRKVAALVDDASERGGRVLIGGEPVRGPGYFYKPTVISGIAPGTRLLQEEIFGPIAPVVEFDSEEQVIAAANDTEFGLVAYVFTRDVARALRVCERLETGMVGLNQGLVADATAPFGGVKQSGLGREGGQEGIGEYLETKYVALASEVPS